MNHKCPMFELDKTVYVNGDSIDCNVCKWNDKTNDKCLVTDAE